MPTRDPTRYSGEEAPEDHIPDGLHAYQGAYQREQSARHEFREAFSHRLDGPARTVFKYQENLAQYDGPDRRNVLDAYIQSFNRTDFNNHKERYDAAQEIAATVFNPLIRQADLQEIRTHAQEFHVLQALRYDGISDNISKDTLSGLEHRLAIALYNTGQAQAYETPNQAFDQAVLYYRSGDATPAPDEEEKPGFQLLRTFEDLQDASAFPGGMQHQVSYATHRSPDTYQAQDHLAHFNSQPFANHLDRLNAAHSDAVSLFGNTADHPSAHLRPTNPHRISEYQDLFANALARSDAVSDNPALLLQEIHREANAYLRGETSYNPDTDDVDYRQAQALSDQDLAFQLLCKVDGDCYSASKAALTAYSGGERHGPIQAYQGITEAFTERLRNIVRHGSEQDFQQASKDLKEQNFQFAIAVREHTGFISQQGYEPPVLPQEFSSTQQAEAYIADVETNLATLRDDHSASPIHLEAVDSLVREVKTEIGFWKEAEEIWTTDPEVHHQHIQTHKAATGIDYLLQPKHQI